MKLPILAPKAFADFTDGDYHAYVKSLYQAPPAKPVPKVFSASVNKKGSLTLRVTREPKFLLAKEVDAMADELGWSRQDLWLAVLKRKIEIRVPERKAKRR